MQRSQTGQDPFECTVPLRAIHTDTSASVEHWATAVCVSVTGMDDSDRVCCCSALSGHLLHTEQVAPFSSWSGVSVWEQQAADLTVCSSVNHTEPAPNLIQNYTRCCNDHRTNRTITINTQTPDQQIIALLCPACSCQYKPSNPWGESFTGFKTSTRYNTDALCGYRQTEMH